MRGIKRIAEGKILIDHLNAEISSSSRVVVSNRFSLEKDFPFIRSKGSGQDLHESRFAGAIIAQQGQYIPRIQLQVYAAERFQGAKPFSHPPHLQQRRRHTTLTNLPIRLVIGKPVYISQGSWRSRTLPEHR